MKSKLPQRRLTKWNAPHADIKYRCQSIFKDGKIIRVDVVKSGINAVTNKREWMATEQCPDLGAAQAYIYKEMGGNVSSYWTF